MWLDLTNEKRQNYGRNTGVYVEMVYEGTSAFKANIVRGDIIYKINNQPIDNSNDLFDFLKNANRGDVIEVELQRGLNNKIIKLYLD